MANVSVSFRVPEETKRRMESVCEELGLSMSAALTMFMNSVGRKRGLPLDVVTLGDDGSDYVLSEEELAKSYDDAVNGRYTVYNLEDDRRELRGNRI